MKKAFPLLIILATVALFSCQKEITGDANTPGTGSGGGGTTGPDSSYIYKIVEIDSVTRDSFVLYFDYDNLKRVTQVRNLEQGFPIDTLYKFFYSGNNMLPYKTMHYPYSHEIFHFYNTQNKLVSDSITDPSDTGQIIYNTRNYRIEDFNYTADKIFIKTTYHWYTPSTNTSQVLIVDDTSKIDANGNILFTRFNYFNETAIQTYNNKPNPLAKLNIFPALDPYNYYEGDQTFIQSPNLWITGYESSQQAFLFTNDSKQINITYNAVNYPVRSIISLSQSGGPLFYWIRNYYYKAL